jgi:hypothetical protein
MKKISTFLVAFLSVTSLFAQETESPLINFDQYETLVATVKEHRKTHLLSLDEFNKLGQTTGSYILDTRSKEMYDRKHVKGAIHLNFSDFTQENLDRLFPDRSATILIYCNNNFLEGIELDPSTLETLLIQDQSFASKVSYPSIPSQFELIEDFERSELIDNGVPTDRAELETEPAEILPENPITLALNIPTYINLYGYGYRNVFELKELVFTNDPRIQFEGTEVLTVEN